MLKNIIIKINPLEKITSGRANNPTIKKVEIVIIM